MDKILIAGATGYLGEYITRELIKRNYYTKVLVRSPEKFKELDINSEEIVHAEITNRLSLKNCCKGIDTVISSVGITKQKDGLTYMDVDYQANIKLTPGS